jgi:hypothetical protein
MKKSLSIFVIALVAIVTFDSCKKGTNDPFLSLRSRKARVAGEWKLTSYSATKTSGSTVTKENFDGSTLTVTTGSSQPTVATLTSEYTFEKDGKVTKSEVKSTTQTWGSTTMTIVQTSSATGTWAFAGGVGDVKKKSQLIIHWTSMTTTTVTTPPGSSTVNSNVSSGTGVDEIYDIDELRNKKMVLKEIHSDGSGSSVSAVDATYTLEAK